MSLALVTLQDFGRQYATPEEVAEAQDVLMYRLFNEANQLKNMRVSEKR
jgi:hypothetical protein